MILSRNPNLKSNIFSFSLSTSRCAVLLSAGKHQSLCHFLAVDFGKIASSTLHPLRNSKSLINLWNIKRIIYTQPNTTFFIHCIIHGCEIR